MACKQIGRKLNMKTLVVFLVTEEFVTQSIKLKFYLFTYFVRRKFIIYVFMHALNLKLATAGYFLVIFTDFQQILVLFST